MADDGTIGYQRQLAAKAGIDLASGGYSGADLLYAGALKEAGLTAGGAGYDAARVQQLAQIRSLTIPHIKSVTPAAGVAAGGTAITLRGVGLTSVTEVRFISAAGAVSAVATSLVVVNDTTITCATPALVAGTWSIITVKPVGLVNVLPASIVIT